MRLRRVSAEDELQALEERATQLAGELERAVAEVRRSSDATHVARRLVAVAHLDGAGLGQATAAERDAESQQAEAARTLALLKAASVELEERISVKRAERDEQWLDQAVEQARRDVARRTAAAAKANETLTAAAVAVAALDAARARANESLAAVGDLRGDGSALDEDEPERSGDFARLAEEIASGPRRPRAKDRRESQNAANQRASGQRARARLLVEQAGIWPDSRRRDRELAQLDEPLRSETLEKIEARRRELEGGGQRSALGPVVEQIEV